MLLGGCRVYLMPTPEALRDPNLNLFEINPEPLSTNTIRTLYATTRAPSKTGANRYAGRKSDELRVGVARVRVGEPDLRLADLLHQSTTGERIDRFPLELVETKVLGSVSLSKPLQLRPS